MKSTTPQVFAVLLASPLLVLSQRCYFPDKTPSRDVPCNSSAPASGCCSSTAYCLSNGLCLNDGLLNRGSCTDSAWESNSCAQYCTNDNPGGGFAIMACTNTTFTCGFYPDNCDVDSSKFTISNADSIVLKSSQLTSAMEAAGISTQEEDSGSTPTTVSVVTVTAAAERPSDARFTVGEMAALGAGMGVPLLVIIGVLSYLLVQEKRRTGVAEIDTFPQLHPPEAREANSWSVWAESSKVRTELGSQDVQELPDRPRVELESTP